MALPAHVRTQISVEEYYLLESQSEERHDWYGGEMFNMSGGTTNHSAIKVNVIRVLGNALRGKPCRPLDSDQRLSIPPTGLRTYPDASVYCGPIEYDPNDEQSHTALNPTAVFEVLSDSTEAYDRGLKADAYRQIPSLRAHVLISQHTPHVEVLERSDEGAVWQFHEARGLDASIRISAIDVTLPLAEIYDRVEFGKAGAASTQSQGGA